MDFAQRLKYLREHHGLSQNQLAAEIKKSRSLICMYESGERTPPYETQELLADFFNVGLDYLMGRSDVYLTTGRSGNAHRIPVYGKVAAGIPLDMVEDIIDYEEIPASWGNPSDFFCLQIEGNSMEPRILSGDVVVVRKQADADTGDVVIYSVNGEAASCKRLRKMDDGLMFIPFNNDDHFPQMYNWEEVESLPVQILGRVVELRGKF